MPFPSASRYTPAPVSINNIPNQYFQLHQPDVIGAASQVNQFQQQERREVEQAKDDEYEKELELVLKDDDDPETPDVSPEDFADRVGEVMLRHGKLKEFEDLQYRQAQLKATQALEAQRREAANKPSIRQFGNELLEIGPDGSIKTIRTKPEKSGGGESTVSVYDGEGKEFRVPKSERDKLINSGSYTSRAPEKGDLLQQILSGGKLSNQEADVPKTEGATSGAKKSTITKTLRDKKTGKTFQVEIGD